MKMQMTMSLICQCKVCGQNMCASESDQERNLVALVGARNFAQCPCCGRTMEGPSNDSAYRTRAIRFIAQKLEGRSVRHEDVRVGRIKAVTAHAVAIEFADGQVLCRLADFGTKIGFLESCLIRS